MANTISRAFELAKSGQCRSLHEIERRLMRERYAQASEHLGGVLIRRQLNGLIYAAALVELDACGDRIRSKSGLISAASATP